MWPLEKNLILAHHMITTITVFVKKIPDSEFKFGDTGEFVKNNQYWVFHENNVVHFEISLLGGFEWNSQTLVTLLHVLDSLLGNVSFARFMRPALYHTGI